MNVKIYRQVNLSIIMRFHFLKAIKLIFNQLNCLSSNKFEKYLKIDNNINYKVTAQYPVEI